MKRVWLALAFVLLLGFPLLSAGIEESFSEIQDYITQYDSGELTAPQLMVYVSYARNKMYEKGEELSESEVMKVFDKIDKSKNKDYWDAEYQKVFEGKDFNLVFKARSFIKNDREYYESREDSERYYYIDYELVPVLSNDFSFEDDLDNFLSKLESTIDDDEKLDYEALQEEFSGIRMFFEKNSFDDENYCKDFVESAGYEKVETKSDEYYDDGKDSFEKIIEVNMKEDCWEDQGDCKEVCEKVEECNEDSTVNCRMEEVCDKDCWEEFDDEKDETVEVCSEEENCHEEEVCDENSNDCWERDECYMDCGEGEEVCNEWEEGRLSLNIECSEEGGSMWLNAWGEKFDRYQPINEGMDWNCEPEIQSLVSLRKALQEDFDEDFLVWYFEEFIGEDYMKIMNGGDVLHDIVWKLINIDERVADSLQCSETGEWPEGFEKIDIVYDDGDTHFEVWEKFIPMEGMDTDYYTTMYKYYWAPDKEMAKKLLNYMVENEFVVGPKDVAKIKSNEGQMALIETLAEKYGGSLDVKLRLSDKEGDFEISRYVRINPEDAVKIQSEEIKTDISIDVDFDVLYDFIISMSKMDEGQKIQGPYWVQIHEGDEGPGNFFSAVGLISKAWREGVTITPKYALIKLFFSAKDIAAFMSSEEASNVNYEKESKINGEVVLTRE